MKKIKFKLLLIILIYFVNIVLQADALANNITVYKDWSFRVLSNQKDKFFRIGASGQAEDIPAALVSDVTLNGCDDQIFQILISGKYKIRGVPISSNVEGAVRVDTEIIHGSRFKFTFDVDQDLIFVNLNDVDKFDLLIAEMKKGSIVRIKIKGNGGDLYFRFSLMGFSDALDAQHRVCCSTDGAKNNSTKESASSGFGSGLIVNSQGYILTSYHVIDGAKKIYCKYLNGSSEAKLIYRDKLNDLALIKVDSVFSEFFKFNQSNIKLGESIIVLGYPLQGFLSTHPSATTGTISSLAGPSDDTRIFQFTAPVQPGNSGGPILNNSGAVVGIVMSKLDAVATAIKIGDIPQNVNFGVNSSIIKNFLNASGIEFGISNTTEEIKNTDIVDKCLRSLVLIKTNSPFE